MPDQPSRPEVFEDVPPRRYWGTKQPPKNRADMFSVHNAAEGGASKTEGASAAEKVATMRLYGPIDSWGGPWGISAGDVSDALDALGSEVTEIRVRLNSPGGDAWEGMAILNMLRAHNARVVAVVDGIAASAASYIAAGVDETVMSPGTQLMIHDASAFAFGPVDTMRKAATMLDSISNSIASLYAEAADGSTEDWRALMSEETWFTAQEAVEAGLADRVAVVKDAGQTASKGADPAAAAQEVEDRFDLTMFNYAGRSHAPAPRLPAASAGGSTPTNERGSAVAFNDAQMTDLRRKLGVTEDADEATILAALDESLAERAEPPTAPTADASLPPAQPTPPAPAAAPTPGTLTIDSSAWEEREARIKNLEAADQRRRRDERDNVIAQAVADGKFPQSRKDHWSRLWDADPEGTRQVIDGLTRNVVPVNELGHGGDMNDAEFGEFDHLFPKGA